MLSLGVFGRKCMDHYKNVISDICLHPNCDTRILCAECRHNHPNDHKPEVKPITHFLQSDIKNDVHTVKGMLSEIDTFHDNITALFENTLNKVKQEFSELIDKKKEEISKIIKPKKAKDEVYWQHIENELLNIQKLCLTATEPNTDNGYILLATYIDKYIEFQERFEGVEAETHNLGSPISFKELENKHEKLIEQIQISLEAFEKSLFEKFPKEHFAPVVEHIEEKKENKEDKEDKKVEVPEVKLNNKTFDVNNLKILQTLNLSSPIGWDSIEYLEEMNLIALGNDLGVLELWSSVDYRMVHSSKVHQSYINCVKYSKKWKKIITTSVDKAVNVMEVLPGPSLKNLKRLEVHKDKVFALLVIDDLDIFISSGRDPDLRIWDLKNQDFKYKISTGGKSYMGTKMEFIPQKNLVVVSFKQGVICLYNVKTGEEVYSVNTLSSEWMHAILYLEKRSELLVGVSKGKIMSWKFQGDKLEPSRIFMIPGDIPSSMVPVDNEESVVLSSKSEEIICLDLNTSKYEASKTLDFKTFVIKDLSSLKKFVVASSLNKVAVIDYA